MLRAKIDVNGELIGEIRIVNRGPFEKTGTGRNYDYAYREWDKGVDIEGRVKHYRSDGFAKLLQIVINDVLERKDANAAN